MPYATTSPTKLLYFVPEGTGSNQTTKPAFTSSSLLGTVGEVNITNEREVVIHEKPVSGVWRDDRVFTQRDRQIFNVTLTELSELFWEILLGDQVVLAGGSASFVPGRIVQQLGWSKLDIKNAADQPQMSVEFWSHASVETADFPVTGLVQVRLRLQRLYSTLNSGNLSNIS